MKRKCKCGYPLPQCIEGTMCPECIVEESAVSGIPIRVPAILQLQGPSVVEIDSLDELANVPIIDSMTGKMIN